ncbi:hypothetical protein GCM10022280_21840 [Sphingomonas swuensis]|uniref:Uncharacterized protein n=1 Tax=Sphingomonas swuensis TaxID=977800 RepID=A0ABP7T4Y0_9SPHN
MLQGGGKCTQAVLPASGIRVDQAYGRLKAWSKLVRYDVGLDR